MPTNDHRDANALVVGSVQAQPIDDKLGCTFLPTAPAGGGRRMQGKNSC
jgi:hypothetical protein